MADLLRALCGVHPALMVEVLAVVTPVGAEALLAQLGLHDAGDVAGASPRFGVHRC
jgi:hypothetical protein